MVGVETADMPCYLLVARSPVVSDGGRESGVFFFFGSLRTYVLEQRLPAPYGQSVPTLRQTATGSGIWDLGAVRAHQIADNASAFAKRAINHRPSPATPPTS